MKTLLAFFLLAAGALAQTPTVIHGYTDSSALPDALVIQTGDDYLTLSVTGIGTPTIFRWLKDGAQAVVKPGGLIAAHHLYIPALTDADAGLYTVEWGAATRTFRVSAGTFVPAAVLKLPPATKLGDAIVLIPQNGATGLKVRWLYYTGREIPGSPRDSLVWTPTAPVGMYALVWNHNPNARVGQQGVILDDATGYLRWAPGVSYTTTWTEVK